MCSFKHKSTILLTFGNCLYKPSLALKRTNKHTSRIIDLENFWVNKKVFFSFSLVKVKKLFLKIGLFFAILIWNWLKVRSSMNFKDWLWLELWTHLSAKMSKEAQWTGLKCSSKCKYYKDVIQWPLGCHIRYCSDLK